MSTSTGGGGSRAAGWRVRRRPSPIRSVARIATVPGFWFAVAAVCIGWGLIPAGAAPVSPSVPEVGLPHRLATPYIVPSAPASGPLATGAAAAGQALPPVWLRIPVIGVDAGVDTVAVDRAGVLEPPSSVTRTGWWPGSAAPGGVGPSVIVGHLDSRTGPAVFAGLSMLKPGDTIAVGRVDGSTAVFRTRRLGLFTKSSFPTAQVYGRTANAQLRLVTCGGDYDRTARTYLGNLVVFADLVSVTPARD